MGMVTFLTILVLVSAFVALITGISALRAGLRLRRTHAALRSHLHSEIDWLVRRATELEESLDVLDARAQALPVQISELQQNLATLRVLMNALGTPLRQSQRILSFAGLRSSLARAFGARAEGSTGATRRGHEDETPRP